MFKRSIFWYSYGGWSSIHWIYIYIYIHMCVYIYIYMYIYIYVHEYPLSVWIPMKFMKCYDHSHSSNIWPWKAMDFSPKHRQDASVQFLPATLHGFPGGAFLWQGNDILGRYKGDRNRRNELRIGRSKCDISNDTRERYIWGWNGRLMGEVVELIVPSFVHVFFTPPETMVEENQIRCLRPYNAGWWFGCHEFYFPILIGNFIIPIDELIFFRGVAQPPTRYVYGIWIWKIWEIIHESIEKHPIFP